MHCMLSVGAAYCCLSFMRVQNVFENLHKRVDVSNFRSIDFPVFTFTAFGNARTRINDNSSRFVSTEDVYCSIIIDKMFVLKY